MTALTGDGPADALREIFEQSRPEIMAQVQVLEDAVAAALGGELHDDERERATREAHKLAGSVGTFGFPGASEHARELELSLGAEAPAAAALPRLAELVLGLRRELEGRTSAPAPPQQDGSPEAAVRPAPPPAGERGPLELLVVDRDPVHGAQLVEEAASHGVTASMTRTLGDAQVAIDRRAPSMVLLDLSAGESVAGALGFLEEASQERLVVVVTDLDASEVDRVEVARRGGRGFLPSSLAAAEKIDSVLALRERLRAAGTRVLAVDDDPGILEAVRAVLEAAKLEVITCEDPRSFWPILEEDTPDLVMLDYDMPHISGLELCRALRNDPRWQGIPVLFLTSRTGPEAVQSVFGAGADDYISKPFVGPELVARIANRLERVRLYRALAETDSVTRLANRRSSMTTLEGFVRMADRDSQPLSLAIMDVDRFKQINDTRGHAAGDAVLRGVGAALRTSFRGEDVAARWGGDEFVVGMYGMSGRDGLQRIGDFVESVRGRRLGAAAGAAVTLSAGLAEYPKDGSDLEALYRAADRALYAAKSEGRDRVAPAGREADDGPASVDVVIVEDDPVLGELLEHSLQTRGYRTTWLTDGVQAATDLAAAVPDLVAPVILLDWDLPGMDGLRVLRRMAERGVLERSRVIMLTGRAAESEVVKALEAGAVDHVAKPFSVPVLTQRVRHALER